jgi:hypothetical protein
MICTGRSGNVCAGALALIAAAPIMANAKPDVLRSIPFIYPPLNQASDAINLVSKYRANLKSPRSYIVCGRRDQYHIHYDSRIPSQRLAEAGIRHRYEEFDDAHSDVDYRMDVSLPFLYRALHNGTAGFSRLLCVALK